MYIKIFILDNLGIFEEFTHYFEPKKTTIQDIEAFCSNHIFENYPEEDAFYDWEYEEENPYF